MTLRWLNGDVIGLIGGFGRTIHILDSTVKFLVTGWMLLNLGWRDVDFVRPRVK